MKRAGLVDDDDDCAHFPENQLGASLKRLSGRPTIGRRWYFPENQLGASLKPVYRLALGTVIRTSPRTNSGPH